MTTHCSRSLLMRSVGKGDFMVVGRRSNWSRVLPDTPATSLLTPPHGRRRPFPDPLAHAPPRHCAVVREAIAHTKRDIHGHIHFTTSRARPTSEHLRALGFARIRSVSARLARVGSGELGALRPRNA